jgi:hypothetical protein
MYMCVCVYIYIHTHVLTLLYIHIYVITGFPQSLQANAVTTPNFKSGHDRFLPQSLQFTDHYSFLRSYCTIFAHQNQVSNKQFGVADGVHVDHAEYDNYADHADHHAEVSVTVAICGNGRAVRRSTTVVSPGVDQSVSTVRQLDCRL